MKQLLQKSILVLKVEPAQEIVIDPLLNWEQISIKIIRASKPQECVMLWCPGVGWAGWRVGAERSLAFRVQKSWLQLGSCESTWECGLVENPTETGKSSATGVSLEHVMTAPSQGCGEAKVKKSRVILEQPSWPGVFYTCVKEGPCPPQLLTAPLQGKSPKSPSLFWLQSSNGSEGDLRITVKLHSGNFKEKM